MFLLPSHHPSGKWPVSQWKQVEQSSVLPLAAHLVICPLCCCPGTRLCRSICGAAENGGHVWRHSSPTLCWLPWPLSAAHLLKWPSSLFCILGQSCGSVQAPQKQYLAFIVFPVSIQLVFLPAWIQSNFPVPLPAVVSAVVIFSVIVIFPEMGKARHADGR